MEDEYLVFDNDEVLFRTRSSIVLLTGLLILNGFALLILSLYLLAYPEELTHWRTLLGLGLPVLGSLLLLRRIRRLHRVVWYLRVMEDGIIAYDYTRQKWVIPWIDMLAMNVTDQGLMVLTRTGNRRLYIPSAFPDYHVLSHALVAGAESRGIPIWIRGKPLEELDLHTLYPFLTSDTPAHSH